MLIYKLKVCIVTSNIRVHKEKLNLFSLPFRKKYRSPFEIIALMLEAVKSNGAARFYLMKHAGINCAQLNNYLESLAEMGFIETDIKEGRVLYRASERGLEFLKQYYVLQGMLLNTYIQNKPTSALYETEYGTFNGQQRCVTRFARRL